MIQFPEVDFKNSKTQITAIFFILIILFFNQLETKALVSLLVIIIGITHYNSTVETLHKGFFTKEEAPKLNYNNKIETILQSLKMYKKDNPVEYRQSMYYWTYFIKEIEILEKNNIYNYNQHFDKAFLYLQKSVNSFQSIGPSLSERKYLEALQYNDFISNKNMKELTHKTEQLYKEGYSLLYNLSIRFNKEWKKNPHVFNKQIVLEYPLPNDTFTKDYDFYL